MQHLLSFTVYDDRSLLGSDPGKMLSSVGADGLELLTSYDPPDSWYRPLTRAVHLPYAADWLAAWDGRPYDMDPDLSRFYMFGRDRGEVVRNITEAIRCAAVLEPAYGVFHAGNSDIRELIIRSSSLDDGRVIESYAEMVNSVVSGFPGGEPPFTILFENLWWPGLRLLDARGFRRLESRIEFDDWGICLDTGHMMNCLPGICSERDGIEALIGIFRDYPPDLIDRVLTVHFHWSASYTYRSTFEEKALGDDTMAFITEAFGHISNIDQHMPFDDPRCLELIDILKPEYVTHEMPGSKDGVLEDFLTQRSLFPRVPGDQSTSCVNRNREIRFL